MHLAEINLARLIAPLEDPRIDVFRNALDPVNAIAERSPGFVWRLKDEDGQGGEAYVTDDDLVLTNMSVWEDAASLEHFVWNTVHRKFYTKCADWFEIFGGLHMALWWVEEGHVPTVEEGKARIAWREAHGDSDHAFGWGWLEKDLLTGE